MEKTRDTEEQIVFALKQAETGGAAQGPSDAQHRWKGGGGWLTPVDYAAAAAEIAAE